MSSHSDPILLRDNADRSGDNNIIIALYINNNLNSHFSKRVELLENLVVIKDGEDISSFLKYDVCQCDELNDYTKVVNHASILNPYYDDYVPIKHDLLGFELKYPSVIFIHAPLEILDSEELLFELHYSYCKGLIKRKTQYHLLPNNDI